MVGSSTEREACDCVSVLRKYSERREVLCRPYYKAFVRAAGGDKFARGRDSNCEYYCCVVRGRCRF